MRLLDSGRLRFGVLVLALFTILAGDAWRYSITWFGFGAIVLAVSAFSVMLLVRYRDRWRVGQLPMPLLAFVVLMTVSIAWSAYPSSSAVGIVATWLTVVSGVAFAVAFTWEELLRALGVALRVILGLSLVFELFVSLVLRRPLLPFWYEYPEGPLAKSLYWSRNVLFDDGKIQGIVGNSTLLAFVALLALIVFGVQLAAGATKRVPSIAWLAVAALTLYLTRSATITIALVAVIVVALAVAAIRAARTGRIRAILYAVFAVGAAGAIVVGLVARDAIFGLLGKSSDLTGRTDIWDSVIGLAQQRPVFGWGWVSYWTPWAETLKDLAFEGGVHQYQAHNAWLDIWLQLGIVGLVVFGALVLSTVVRSWFFAVDRRITVPGERGRYSMESLLPILVLTALLMQSLAESRLIIEYGLLLLTITAVKTRMGERGTLP
jgi:O-antigen ligase